LLSYSAVQYSALVGLILARLEDVRRQFDGATAHEDTAFEPLRRIATPSPVVALQFAHQDQSLIVSLLSGGIALYSVASLVDGSKARSFAFGSEHI
jgi:hypothetical protein